MKKTLLLAYLALLFSLLLPAVRAQVPLWDYLAAGSDPAPAEGTAPPGAGTPAREESTATEAPTAAPESAVAPETAPVTPSPAPEPLSGVPAAPENLLVLLEDGSVEQMDMQTYLTGVLAAEMPASFQSEALKAQAVAARTYAMYCAAGHKHGQADICTDSTCCQAWQSPERQQEKWGEDYALYADKIRAAVDATAGQYLLYDGQPVFAAFHASSAGATEASGELWSPVPYLVSVESPETAEDVPNYVSTLDCAALDFRDVILSAYPEADFTGPEETWIGPLTLDDSGRVRTACLGGVEIPGARLRSLFSLRSTAFTLTYHEGRFLFTVTGSGHGVGMSQYGAQVMAESGEDYTRILAHYYPGTSLVD